ncbi:hypothetical protein GYB22_07470 [bacterium]|nr:hypothetical protein [bacterium]
MKKISILLLATLALLSACKDKEDDDKDDPKPEREKAVIIEFGYTHPDSFNMTAFLNQDEIFIDSLLNLEQITIELAEENIEITEDIEDGFAMSYQLKTDNDTEYFTMYDNVPTPSSGYTQFGSYSYVYCETSPYIKITDKAIPGNDTLEISDKNDWIILNYTSEISTQSASDSIRILGN